MVATDRLLLAAWQEVSRHLEVLESAGLLAQLMERHLPLESLVARRFDADHRSVLTVASWPEVSVTPVDAEVFDNDADWRDRGD